MKKFAACALFALFATALAPSSASAAVILGPFTGVLDTTDPVMTQRLFRNEPPSTCAVPQPASVVPSASDLSYETFTFFNSGPAECVTVEYSSDGTGSEFDQLSAYAGSFNPANVLQNYLADAGISAGGGPSILFSFIAPADSPFVIVANAVVDRTAGPFAFTVSGESINVGRTGPTAPEPAAMALLGLGFAAWRRTRRAA